MPKLSGDKFNFFVPATFEKGKDKVGKSLTKIKGIASSAVADSDEETLFPSGFDYEPFLKAGILNYNHQSGKTSKAIVGEPTHAEVINGGKDFYIEGVVYPNEEGTAIVEQAEIFEKYSPTRRFGFSIEGQATKRDPLNPKRILEARITGCAITAQPKNPNTLMSILKGEYADPYVSDDEDDIEKEMDVASIAPATPESVEHSDKPKKGIKNLTKSEVYESIINKYDIKDFVFIKEIYNFVKSVNDKSMEAVQKDGITPEALTKAYNILDGIVKGESPATIVKAEDTADKDKEEKEKADIKKAQDEMLEIAKSMYGEFKDKSKCIEGMIKKGYSLEASQGAVESIIASASAEPANGGTVSAEAAPIVKSEPTAAIGGNGNAEVQKIDMDAITKSIQDTIGASMQPVNDQIIKGFGAVSDALKEQEKNNSIVKSELDKVIERIGKLEQTPLPTKSIRNVGVLERFSKSKDGDGKDISGDGYREVSVSDRLQKGALVDEMFDAFNQTDNKVEKALLSDAIQTFEASNFIDKRIAERMKVRLVQ